MKAEYSGRANGDVGGIRARHLCDIEELFDLCRQLARVHDGAPASLYAMRQAEAAEKAAERALWLAVYDYGVSVEEMQGRPQDELDDDIPF